VDWFHVARDGHCYEDSNESLAAVRGGGFSWLLELPLGPHVRAVGIFDFVSSRRPSRSTFP
jgi:hypothetical protein